ncbi:MAG: RNA polymerase sigma factor [Planctomycetota bacterium]
MQRDHDYDGAEVRAASAGDKAAYEALVRRYQDRLRGYLARHLFDAEDVHDLLQESFIAAWESLPRFTAGRPFWPWLRAIARNHLLMYFRSRARNRPAHLVALDETVIALVDAQGSAREDRRLDALRHCLQRLDDAQRRLLRERFLAGAAVRDLARRAQTSAASVTMRLRRLRLSLAACVDRRMRCEEGS